MPYRTLKDCVDDLLATRQMVRIEDEIDPYLMAAAIHRRVNRARGPALYFARVAGCRFPMVSNLFGTLERTRYMFRDTLDRVRRLVELKIDPARAARRPLDYAGAMWSALHMVPKRVGQAPVLTHSTTIGQLPQLVCWPKDGGPFITLPLVYTEDPDAPGWQRSNLGMYRVQLGGNQYRANEEVGLHYQIHRGIGVHHAAAIRRGEPLRVNILVGGPPAWMMAAVMPLPERLSELTFAGALGGRRVPLWHEPSRPALLAEADFCITGTIDPARQLPEGPFGDHLGYYAMVHDFPVLRVERVTHRPGAIWPFTVVGRPPQEDTSFGEFIHELTGPAIPSVIAGVHAVHAVDAAGVHPLLLAIGSERYTPYAERSRPRELLTQANAILGQGQLSLAKYLWIVAKDDAPALDIHDIVAFFRHVLERVDWRRDLHFQTSTTIDTLDYSGDALNEGSKLVVAAVGPPQRSLAAELPRDMPLPGEFSEPRLALAGMVAVRGPQFTVERGERDMETLCAALAARPSSSSIPLVVVMDDSAFAAATLNNFLWVTFTRSNPAADVYGAASFVRHKHWGCEGPLVIDARIKPHHAPPLEEDPEIERRVDALATRGQPLHGIV